MKITAQAVTDRRGYQSVSGFFLDDLKAQRLGGETKPDVWDVQIRFEIGTLRQLLSSRRHSFSLLVNRLIHVNKLDPESPIEFGSASGIRAVIMGDTEYRESKRLIYTSRKRK